MLTDDLCPLSELPPAQCACPRHRGGHAPGEEPIETVGQPFTALYLGRCARGCSSGIEVGDQIARHADAEQGYAHAGRCPR